MPIRLRLLTVANIVPDKLGAFEGFMAKVAVCAQRHDVEARYMLAGDPHPKLAEAGAKLHVVKTWNDSADRERKRQFLKAYFGTVRKFPCDAVGFHFCNELPVVAAVVGHRQFFSHGRHPRFYWHQTSQIVNKANMLSRHVSRLRMASWVVDGLTTVYRQGMEALLERNVSPAKVCCIYNGVETEDARSFRNEECARLGFAADEFVIITVASLIPRKSIDTILRATAALLAERAKLKLVIVGVGEEEQSLKALSRELGLEASVVWLGKRDDVPRLLAASDVFVLASRAEPFGLVNVEAMAQHLPVVSTRVGGIPEIVDEGVTGLLFPPGRWDLLAESLRQLIRLPALRQSYGEAGYRKYVRLFRLEANPSPRTTHARPSGIKFPIIQRHDLEWRSGRRPCCCRRRSLLLKNRRQRRR
jgi:glycosyltransferase involved in cell wall biosynthesis